MKFNLGDKVKFMDQEGQGTVTKIISAATVGVTVDGFEIPCPITDLIKMDAPSSTAERLFYEGKATYGDPQKDATEEKPKKSAPQSTREVWGVAPSDLAAETEENGNEENRISPLRRGFTGKQPQPEGIYIALVPLDQQFMLRGPLELYIVNHTPYTLLYSLATKGAEAFYGVDYASVPPYSKILVESIEREDLGLWTEGLLQGLFYQDDATFWLSPFSKDYKIRAPRIGQAENYILPVFMREKALLVSLCTIEEHRQANSLVHQSLSETQTVKPGKENAKVFVTDPQNPLQPYMIQKSVAEVDLHVEKLLQTRKEFKDAVPEDYLTKQLAVFETCLNQAIGRRLSNIIFIHGVGNGILKHEIEKRLKQYEGLHYMDASSLKYGRGAIEVFIDTQK